MQGACRGPHTPPGVRGPTQVARRKDRIDGYAFPPRIRARVRERYPHLREPQTDLVIDGLREYFHLCNAAGRRVVAMPSQAVDVAWHEFILFTRHYRDFCRKAFGRFLHHTPAEAMSSPTIAHEGIKRAWRLACHREQINRRSPTRLPLLFALDGQLEIPDGFRYALNCRGPGASGGRGDGYCASHIGCGSGCGGGCFGDGGSSGCGGDGGSDGGGGCGGGGCGGGD